MKWGRFFHRERSQRRTYVVCVRDFDFGGDLNRRRMKIALPDTQCSLPRDLDRRFRSRDVDRRRSSAPGPTRLAPGGPPRRVEPRPPPKISIVRQSFIDREFVDLPRRLGRQSLTVRPRSTSTTTRRPSIFRPSAFLHAAESEVLTVKRWKCHRRFVPILTAINLPSFAHSEMHNCTFILCFLNRHLHLLTGRERETERRRVSCLPDVNTNLA